MPIKCTDSLLGATGRIPSSLAIYHRLQMLFSFYGMLVLPGGAHSFMFALDIVCTPSFPPYLLLLCKVLHAPCTDMHHTPISASKSQILGVDIIASLHVQGTQTCGWTWASMGFFATLFLSTYK
uniref:Uncharacterized protein n=1 Tax=Eutreptiella gymnastica TaxID=73025 RepID=A0A6U8P748_9EUGL